MLEWIRDNNVLLILLAGTFASFLLTFFLFGLCFWIISRTIDFIRGAVLHSRKEKSPLPDKLASETLIKSSPKTGGGPAGGGSGAGTGPLEEDYRNILDTLIRDREGGLYAERPRRRHESSSLEEYRDRLDALREGTIESPGRGPVASRVLQEKLKWYVRCYRRS